MNEDSITISATTFRALPQEIREAILRHLTGEPASVVSEPVVQLPLPDDGPADLTKALTRKAVSTMSDKTISALRAIAETGPRFCISDVLKAVDGARETGDLRGVWGAITRRTRNVLNDPDAELIWWDEDGIYAADGRFIDQYGRVSALTYESLKAYFGLE